MSVKQTFYKKTIDRITHVIYNANTVRITHNKNERRKRIAKKEINWNEEEEGIFSTKNV